MKAKGHIWKIIRTIIIAAISFTMLYPFIWMLSASFTVEKSIYDFPFKLIPNPITLQGYIDIWTNTTVGYPLTVYFFNSLKVTLIGVIGSLIACSLAAYGYTKIEFPGRDKIFFVKISTMMIPLQVVMLPNFMIYKFLGLVDTHAALYIGSCFGAAFGTFLLRQAFITIPKELNEAAEIDGANNFRIYSQIIMPLAKPALATLLIFTFMYLWNGYEMPLIYIRSPKLYTLPLGLAMVTNDMFFQRDGAAMAGAVCSALPLLLLFIFAQKYFIQGIASTGIKG